MEKLTREEKLSLCIKAKDRYERNKGKMGLCEVFTTCYNKEQLTKDWIKQSDIFEYIPELLHYKPAGIDRGQFWWEPKLIGVRMEVLRSMIKRFSE